MSMELQYEIATGVAHQNFDAARIAILMCTKNGAAFRRDQLESIADQSHTNWVLIVSDDGSTDETREILKTFADSQVPSRGWWELRVA